MQPPEVPPAQCTERVGAVGSLLRAAFQGEEAETMEGGDNKEQNGTGEAGNAENSEVLES